MKALALTSLLLVLLLVSLSAYLRLAHSGIGCADWPDCYGEIGSSESLREAAEPAPSSAADALAARISWRVARGDAPSLRSG